MTDKRPDGRMDRRVDSWTGGRPRQARWRTRAGRPSRAGKTGRVGTGGQDGLPEHERCPREASYKGS